MIGLTYIREKEKMTKEQLAEELGVTKQTVSLWESRKLGIPEKRVEVLSKIFLIPEKYWARELSELDCLEIDKITIEAARDKLESEGIANKDYIDSLNEEISSIWSKIERKKTLQDIEKNMLDTNSIEIYKVLNVLLRKNVKINKKLLYDTLHAMQMIFAVKNEDDAFTKTLGKILKQHNQVLEAADEAMLDLFADEVTNPMVNRLED